MRQAQLRQGLAHQAFAGRYGMRVQQPPAQLIDRGVGLGCQLGCNRIVQPSQFRRHVSALWPSRHLARQPTPA